MNGLLGNDFLDRDVQAKRIAEQRRQALMKGMLDASKLSGKPPRELSEQEMQVLLNPPLLPSLQESIESASEDPYTSHIPSQQDMWKSQAHSMSPNYLAQDSESVELPSHHAIHGGGYPIPPPQSAETLSSIHERGFIPFSGESIPFDHPSIAGESIPVTMAMHEQMIPGLHKYFGGGHPDEISLTQAPQHYGYDQFSRQKGLLDSEPSDDDQAAYQALLNEVPSSKPVKTTGRTGKGWESQREFDPNNRRRYNPAWAAMITGGLDIAFD